MLAITGADGSYLMRLQYEGFGEVTEDFGFGEHGRQLSNTKDQDVRGLVNEGFRYRDLETGQFLTRDPMGFVDGPNVYTYVVQNPWTRVDPQGLFWETIWDVGNVIYDVGRFVKNGVEVAAGGAMYAYGHVTGDEHFKAAAGEFTRKNAGELAEATVDIAFDTAAAAMPFVPAGGSKIARSAVQHGDEIVDATRGLTKTDDAVKTAEALNDGKQAAKAADSATKKQGIYEFPDQKADGKPYVGQSGDLDSRLKKHESTGRLKSGTETTTEVNGGKTAREIAEHKRIQEITEGVPASKSETVSNKVDPIGPKRQHLLKEE